MILTYVLTGAHSTGKSTLMDALRTIPGYEFSESVTRTSGAILNQDGDEDGQLKILQAIIDYENNNGVYTKDFILDRSFIDFLAYTMYLHRRNKISPDTLQVITDEFLKRIPYYKQIFYLPIEFDIELDGVRSDNKSFQREIDEIIRSILIDWQLPFIPLHGSIDERASTVKANIPFIGHVTNKSVILDTIGYKEGFEEYLDDDSYVVYHNNTIVSLLSYKKTDRLKISYLYTDPSYRGSKLATKLMNKLLKDHTNIVVYLYIKADAMPFYTSYGIDKFIVGESIYSGPIPNYYATFHNGNGVLTAIDIDEAIQSRLKP